MGRRPRGEAPCVRVDRSSGCGRVIIGGKTHWLGRCPGGRPTAEQQARAARLWHEFLSGHEPAPAPRPVAVAAAAPPVAAGQPVDPAGLTVAAVGLRWLDHCEAYYRDRDGGTTSSVDGARMALRCLLPFGDIVAAAFSPKDLTVVRDAMIRAGRPRVTCNAVVRAIRRMFKWAVGEGLVPASTWLGLTAVAALRKGRTTAPECEPVEEVPEPVVEATLPHLAPIVAAMVWLQRWTGARPSEVCLVRPCDIDRRGDVWVFAPQHHKLDWREDARPRRIPIGAEGQRVLTPYLLRAAEAYCFSPSESERHRSRARRAERCSPMTPSQAKRKPKRDGQRRPGERYTSASYRRAIHRAIEMANRERAAAGLEPLPRWSPNQLRHLRAGELQERLGIEHASAVLGHTNLRTTEIYARRQLELAIDATRRLG
jgi:integrase